MIAISSAVTPIERRYPATDFENEVNQDGGITITNYVETASRVVIPEEIEGKSVTELGQSAFFEDYHITELILPDSLIIIGVHAIHGLCITEIEIPKSVKIIQRGGLRNNFKLESITLHEGLVTIEDTAFCFTNITEIIIPKTVKDVADYAFYHCDNLTAVKFEGDAPNRFKYTNEKYDPEWLAEAPNITVYYHKKATGFTSPEWNGYPTEIW